MSSVEEELGGGWGQEVQPVKIGNTVHRQNGENAEYVHDVLVFLEQQGFDWAPRYLGQDEQDREVITFIDGYTPHGQEVPPETWSLTTMTEIFQNIRKLHDITEATPLAQDKECICHGDLGFANTVYEDGKAIAFIDWDLARPGNRVDDLAHAIAAYLSLGVYVDKGAVERAELARKLADAYGATTEQRSRIVDSMLSQLQEAHDKQLGIISSGSELGKRLAEANVPKIIQKRIDWILQNRSDFDKAL
ncbi:MAG: phosphotransferase [bacterium]